MLVRLNELCVNTAVEMSMIPQSVQWEVECQTVNCQKTRFIRDRDEWHAHRRPKCQSSDSATSNASAFISIVRCVPAVGENKEEHIEKVVVLAKATAHFLLGVVGKVSIWHAGPRFDRASSVPR